MYGYWGIIYLLQNHNAAVVRMNKRKIDFVKEKCTIISLKDLDATLKNDEKKVILRFLLDPIKIEKESISCVVTKLEG